MTDFVEELKTTILKGLPSASKDWAEFCAIQSLGTMLPHARVIDQYGSLKVNLIGLMVGLPGTIKTLPMMTYTRPIIEKTGELLERDFMLPSRNSVEGFIKYASERDPETKTYKHNQGIILRDEFTGMFKQARTADWQSDALEFVSEIYDNTFQKRFTIEHGLNEIKELHCNIMTASTYHFIQIVDPQFFEQGTGNRFIYFFYDPKDYPVKREDEIEFFRMGWGKEREDKTEHYAGILAGIYRRNLANIYIYDCGDLWVDYKYKCESEWKKRAIRDPRGWDYHPMKRYPELALKLAGIYAVSRMSDKFATLPNDLLNNFTVTKPDMIRAIAFIERSRKAFEKIVEIKNTYKPSKQTTSRDEQAKSFLQYLISAPNGELTITDWFAQQEVTSNRGEMQELKEYCVAHGWVKEIPCGEATEAQRKHYKMLPRSILCKYVAS